MTTFRKLLLKECQREFANTVAELVNIEKAKKEIKAIKDVGYFLCLILFIFINLNGGAKKKALGADGTRFAV